jgi:hypothetical protein
VLGQLAKALTVCPELCATAEHVREFADLINKSAVTGYPTGCNAYRPTRNFLHKILARTDSASCRFC